MTPPPKTVTSFVDDPYALNLQNTFQGPFIVLCAAMELVLLEVIKRFFHFANSSLIEKVRTNIIRTPGKVWSPIIAHCRFMLLLQLVE